MQSKLLSLLSVLLYVTQIFAWSNVVYVIREAEKASMGAGGLTPVGRSRASSCLVSRFGKASGADIGKIISCRPDPDTGKCDAAFQTVAPLAADLGLSVDVTCTTDETKSIKTCLFEVIKSFAATSAKGILVVWDTEEMDGVFDNFDFENDDPDFPDEYPDMVATIKNNVFLGLNSELCPSLDGNSGSPLTAPYTINPAIPTPTPTASVVPRDITPEVSNPVPVVTLGAEEFSLSLTTSSTITASAGASAVSQLNSSSIPPTSSTSLVTAISIATPLTTTFAPPVVTITSSTASSGSFAETEPTPFAIDVEVDINVGGHPRKSPKGCKYANPHYTIHHASPSTILSLPTSSTTDNLPFSTVVSSSAPETSVSTTSVLSAVLPTLSAVPSSIDSFSASFTASSAATDASAKSVVSSTASTFPLQTPSFGNFRRMIKRHKKREALRL